MQAVLMGTKTMDKESVFIHQLLVLWISMIMVTELAVSQLMGLVLIIILMM